MSTKKITLKITAPHEYDDVHPLLIAEDLMPDNVEWELLSEPVYTQSEVVAMLREMEEDYHTETSRQQFYAIAAAHGFTL